MELNPRIQQLGTTSRPHAGTLDVKEKIVCHAECIQLIDRIFPVVVLDASTRCKHKGISTRYLNKIHIPVSIRTLINFPFSTPHYNQIETL